jgi:hypothetical protein
MFNPITGIKDTLASKAISCALQKRMAGFGSVVSFTLNSQDKIIKATLRLDGEVCPAEITITGYEFEHVGHNLYFKFRNMATSKEWLTALAKKYPEKMRFEIPEKYRGIIGALFKV